MLNYFQQVLTQTSVIYLILEPNGTVSFVSPGLEKILGLDPANTIDKNWFDITRINEEDRVEMKKNAQSFLDSDDLTTSYVSHLQDICGKDVYIVWNIIKTTEGQIIGTGQDITQKVLQEKMLTAANQSLNAINTHMKDSINYAARLQKAILKNPDILREEFTDLSIFYQPKDVVSGDIYFFTKSRQYQYVAVIDCTGHGVPGAMLSLIANTLLRNIVKRKNVSSVSDILKKLDFEFINYLNENNSSTIIADGLDIALIQIDREKNVYSYAGAFRPMIILKNGEVEVVKASKYPIGFYNDVEKKFEEITRPIIPNERIILFSDGMSDQFGGTNSKKLNRRRMIELFSDLNDLKGRSYEAKLKEKFDAWQGDNIQTDDVTVVAFAI